MKKKVFLIITKSNFGGAQRYVFDLATSLPKDHYDVTVVLGGRGVLYKKLQERRVRTISLSTMERDISFGKEVLSFFALIRLLKREKPDIVHLNSSKAGGLGALAGRLAGVPRIVFTVHAFAFNEPRPWYQKTLIAVLSYITILLTDTTICVSHALQKQTRWWPFVSKKIHVVHIGTSPFPLLGRTEAHTILAEKIGVTPDFFKRKAVVLMLAELHPVKGIDVAIEAWSRSALLKEHALLIVLGEGEARAHLENLRTTHKLEHVVFLPGFVENGSTLLRGGDIFLFPSRSEALGYALLEAGLASLPAVASQVGGIPEVITSNSCGILVPPEDARALQKALEHILTLPREDTTLGINLYKRVRGSFTLETMVEKTEAHYTAS